MQSNDFVNTSGWQYAQKIVVLILFASQPASQPSQHTRHLLHIHPYHNNQYLPPSLSLLMYSRFDIVVLIYGDGLMFKTLGQEENELSLFFRLYVLCSFLHCWDKELFCIWQVHLLSACSVVSVVTIHNKQVTYVKIEGEISIISGSRVMENVSMVQYKNAKKKWCAAYLVVFIYHLSAKNMIHFKLILWIFVTSYSK